MGFLIVIVLLFFLFWLFIVRPQRRQASEQRELLESLEPGDEIVSAGGLYGVIREIEGDELRVEIADGLVVRMARGAVAGFVEPDEEPEPESESLTNGDDSVNPSQVKPS
jgi:preprotein translocase subunit YajC